MNNIIDCELNDKINEKIYLGCIYGAQQTDYLKFIGVYNILSVCDCNLEKSAGFNYLLFKIEDELGENILKYFKTAIEFIDSCDKVYVHCMAGVSRSPTIVIAYLMWKNKIGYNDAYWLVKNKRKYISPNYSFTKQLNEFEMLLRNNYWNLQSLSI